jgi:alginate O-acetyltransferase complex protein AlgI
MLFNSIKYLLFLPTVFALFWASPKRFRVPILLIASYVFYISWRPVFLLLILGLTAVNFLLGNRIASCSQNIAQKKLFLSVAVATNLLTLAFFKYAYFLDDLCIRAMAPMGIHIGKLPVVDIYRGSQPIKSLANFALFASFFPTQIAGPIKRYQDFLPQFEKPEIFSIENFDDGVALILLGLCKKVLVADTLSFFVSAGYGHAASFTGLDLWFFTWAFAFQIYFDFSGYTDIARGSALLFSFKVPINFNLPYLSQSVSEFWRRWHISLSTWLRDYLFIPLGGSRCSRLLTARNLIITMTLGGLWHGASAHFLAWGLYHGILLTAHREFTSWKKNSASSLAATLSKALESRWGSALSLILTFQAVCVGWVFFRADSLKTSIVCLRKMFFIDEFATGHLPPPMVLPVINYPLIFPYIFVLLPLLVVSHLAMGKINETDFVQKTPNFIKAAWCLALILLIVIFSPDQSPRFIYFQF